MPYRPVLLPYTLFEADPVDLPVRGRGDKGGPDYIVKAAITREDQHGITLDGTTLTGKAARISVRVVAPGIIHVLLENSDTNPKRVTLARDLSHQAVDVVLRKSENGVNLITDQVTVQVTLDPFQITYYGPDGRVVLGQNNSDTDVTDRLICLPFGYTEIDGERVAFHDSFTVEPDEHFYGFGEKFTDFDKRGQRLVMWHYDAYGAHSERAYKNVPFFISTRGYGIFVDSTTAVQFDMASSSHSTFSLIVPDTALDYYVIVGPEPKTVVSRYADLVSHPILPPKWAFGLWVSSGFFRDTAEDVLQRATELRERDVPADVLHLDCYWQRHGRWSDMQWDNELFPDPADLLKQVHEMGFKVCLWINSYIGVESPLLEEARQKGYLLKLPDGKAWIGDLWGGDGHFHPPVGIVDVTHPEAAEWFKSLLRPSLEIGADVFKTDFGEGIPADVIAHNGMTGKELHNLYPLLYNDLVAEVSEEVTGRPGLVWGRSTYAGGQRHAAQWGGDPNCTFQSMASTLRGGLSMAMCGHAFWSHDIGGFHRTPTPELYARWAQFGLFSPLSRAHGMSSRLPWDFGEEAERIFREYVKLRYQLMPYIYAHAVVSHETGLPLIRPMVLEFPNDPTTYAIDLQYMFGEDLLVAPIYNSSGQRPVYFPAGQWIDYWTHEVIIGPHTRVVEAPLDTLPLYVRANALIPTIEPKERVGDKPFELVTFDAYLLDQGSFRLHDTDGETEISASLRSTRLEIEIEGVKKQLGFRLLPLPGSQGINSVMVNGEVLERRAGTEIEPEAAAGWMRDASGIVHVMVRRS